MPPIRALLAAIACVAALAGCGGGDDGDDGAPVTTTDAPQVTDPDSTTVPDDDDEGEGDDDGATGELCALVEGVDADAVLNEPAGEPVEAGAFCRIEAADAESTGFLAVSLRDAGAYDQQLDLLGSDREVAGLGDEAFQSGGFLVIRSGDVTVLVQTVRHPLNDGFGDFTDADFELLAAQVLANAGG
jgi:hypothetical protein